MVLIQMLGQTASPERLRQVAEVVPEEATLKRIPNSDEATFRGMYLVNAAERRIAGKRSIAQEHSYLRAHVEAATARRRARSALRDAERRWGPLLSWRTAGDSRVTPDCAVLNGKNFFAWSPPGGRPPGAVHPRCFPAGTVVSGPRVEASVARWYSGEILDIRFVSGRDVTVTPNHPVLTPQGWVAAGLLEEGGDVVCGLDLERVLSEGVHPDEYQVPAPIEDVARAVGGAGGVSTRAVPTAPEDFHGDGVGSKVHVVRAHGLLRGSLDAELVAQPPLKASLERGDGEPLALSGERELAERLNGDLSAPDRSMRSLDVLPVLFGGAAGHHQAVRIGVAPEGNAPIFEPELYDVATRAVLMGEGVDRVSGEVTLDYLLHRELDTTQVGGSPLGFAEGSSLGGGADKASPAQSRREGLDPDPGQVRGPLDALAGFLEPDSVLHVRRRTFDGHVYNLQTAAVWYLANGLIVHNCRCVSGPPLAGAPVVGIVDYPRENAAESSAA
jgi:hypothetical protein